MTGGADEDALSFDIGGVLARWDPERRLLRIHHTLGSSPDAPDAEEMRAHLDRWIRDGPADMLVNAQGAGGVTLGYRLAWNRWFYDRRDRLRVAAYNASLLDRNLIPVFAALTGCEMRTFGEEAEALAWLESGRAGGGEPI